MFLKMVSIFKGQIDYFLEVDVVIGIKSYIHIVEMRAVIVYMEATVGKKVVQNVLVYFESKVN